MKKFESRGCPRCGASKTKEWKELDEEQKMLAEKMPANTAFSAEERKRHRFCERCLYEFRDDSMNI